MKTIRYAAVAALFPLTAFAHDGMAVKDAYMRSTNPKVAAAFMVLDNHRAVACTLTGVSSDAAEKVELHTHQETDGVMKMGKIEGGIEVPAKKQHALQRGGDHVMMMGLHTPVQDGQTVMLTLDFGECGTLDVDVPVDNQRSADTPAPATEVDHSDH